MRSIRGSMARKKSGLDVTGKVMDQTNFEKIIVRGAREHNLQAVNLEIPKNQLIVFSGVSGSGKSSLAFDTLFAEGQRRYVESLSSYARQFLGQLPKPDVEYLGGLSPSISIQQKTAGRNPRSTVGTITEIHDFLRVLYARVGVGHCPQCQGVIQAQGRDQILESALALDSGTPVYVLAPVVKGQKGEFKDLLEGFRRKGFLRARVDGDIVQLDSDLNLDRKIKHNIEVVIDRLKVGPDARGRVSEAIETALNLANGELILSIPSSPSPSSSRDDSSHSFSDRLFNSRYACAKCDLSFTEATPQLFSFNSPLGMCKNCDGLGAMHTFDPELLIPDDSLSFHGGAIPLVGKLTGMGRWRKHIFEGVGKTLGIDLKKPWKTLPPDHRSWLLDGSGDKHITFEWKQRGGGVWKHGGKWEGVVPQLMASFRKAASGPRRLQLEKYMRTMRCPSCRGGRLNSQARAVRVSGLTLVEAERLPIEELAQWLAPAEGALEKGLDSTQFIIASEVLKEIRGRVKFLLDVGLDYLTLERQAPTLSGGEAQRIRLAGQIGCGLVGVLYILDEPSIGLHPRDNDRLIRSLQRLRDIGNTVIVVEHDEDTMLAADWIVDFGPGPGVLGGHVVASGDLETIKSVPDSLTGNYLTGARAIPIPAKRRKGSGFSINVFGARHHNLRGIDVDFPLGKLICVTGASGSGKSSLINDILRPGLAALMKTGPRTDSDEVEDVASDGVGDHDRIDGVENVSRVISIDQAPIGRTPRSNPATYIKLFDEIRLLFSMMAEAKARGYGPGRFSFNRPGGRCEACEGNGSTKLEMDFLADVWVKCPVCDGRRFNHETLQVRHRGKNIQEILDMDVAAALQHFEAIPRIKLMLETLHAVGLDYLKLGQSAPTLSGGEAQRVKLARELCKRSDGGTLYILDEPTTGLHFEDVRRLLEVLHGFVDSGNSVLVIEHNLDVIKTADWVIDLGPEGGSRGGELIAVGTPETVAKSLKSHTGVALARLLGRKKKGIAQKDNKSQKRPALPNKKPQGKILDIQVKGAFQHNLKNVSLEIPRAKATVFCGPSGSGKTSLAIDTIYAEGQRRYVESLSSYARQFLGQVEKPKVEQITGLSPAICIEQKTASKSPRSTVGTVTEIHDYLRVLYARLGTPHCVHCKSPVGAQSADEIIERVQLMQDGTRFYLLAPVQRRGQETIGEMLDGMRRDGFARVRIDGISYEIDKAPEIDHRRKHSIEVVVDRLVVKQGQRARLADGVEKALSIGKGILKIAQVDLSKPEKEWQVETFSRLLSCQDCGKGYAPLEPHHFSFNSPLGWCSSCEGLGFQKGTQENIVIRDVNESLRGGALAGWPALAVGNPFADFAAAMCAHLKAGLDDPWVDLSPLVRKSILHGFSDGQLVSIHESDGRIGYEVSYKGVFPALREAAKSSSELRDRMESLVGEVACSGCDGSRLMAESAAVRLDFDGNSKSIQLAKFQSLSLVEALQKITDFDFQGNRRSVAAELVREIRDRLTFLVEVGLGYLSLDRPTPTLSGGEAQRIRLASQIGSGLTGVLYVLDEPTIGLHPRDNKRLLAALTRLRDLGNTLLMVEHEREVLEWADHLVDFGPGAGDLGGRVTSSGFLNKICKDPRSLTGNYLGGKKAIPMPEKRRIFTDSPLGKVISAAEISSLVIRGARQNNLANLTVSFPLSCFVAVTGVSGSGKSSLVNEVLRNTLARNLHGSPTPSVALDGIDGMGLIDKVIDVGQEPIGTSPLSNPATYTGLFDLIRELFARLPDSKIRGWQPGRFSFNRQGGRCESCQGNGQRKIEMHFLPDVWITCEFCKGKRYNLETLDVRFKGKSISDVLEMRVAESLEFFEKLPKIRHLLSTLNDVGLGYMRLGQAAPTLSGGEAQRVKLATELARPSTGKTLYILDEPTTGLHFDDVAKLVEVLHRLVDGGNTVVVVEHNLEIIKNADWIIELGPEAGMEGGQLVSQGRPEAVALGVWESFDGSTQLEGGKPGPTAVYLNRTLKESPRQIRTRPDFSYDLEVVDCEDDIDQIIHAGKLPWEEDGKKWHSQTRITTDGKPCRWDGQILVWIDAEVKKLGGFKSFDWNDRSVVECSSGLVKKPATWFFHGMTGTEWLVRLVFRVAKGTFDQDEIEKLLGIKPLDQTEGLQVYGSEPRVRVANLKKQHWQVVTILAHYLEEVKTASFREFLSQAGASYQSQIQKMSDSSGEFMPWQLLREKWHLSDKGFTPGKGRRWDAALLPELLGIIRKVMPTAIWELDKRDVINVRLTEGGRIWAVLRTKDADTLVLRMQGPAGGVNLSHLAGLGLTRSIKMGASGTNIVQIAFSAASDFAQEKVRPFLEKHAEMVREWVEA